MKAYFVELRISAVVMAESEMKAMCAAELESSDIVFDGDLEADSAIEVKSLEHLKQLDGNWDGMCIPYNHDGSTRLKEILPEEEPFKDTKTIDMFSGQQTGRGE